MLYYVHVRLEDGRNPSSVRCLKSEKTDLEVFLTLLANFSCPKPVRLIEQKKYLSLILISAVDQPVEDEATQNAAQE